MDTPLPGKGELALWFMGDGCAPVPMSDEDIERLALVLRLTADDLRPWADILGRILRQAQNAPGVRRRKAGRKKLPERYRRIREAGKTIAENIRAIRYEGHAAPLEVALAIINKERPLSIGEVLRSADALASLRGPLDVDVGDAPDSENIRPKAVPFSSTLLSLAGVYFYATGDDPANVKDPGTYFATRDGKRGGKVRISAHPFLFFADEFLYIAHMEEITMHTLFGEFDRTVRPKLKLPGTPFSAPRSR